MSRINLEKLAEKKRENRNNHPEDDELEIAKKKMRKEWNELEDMMNDLGNSEKKDAPEKEEEPNLAYGFNPDTIVYEEPVEEKPKKEKVRKIKESKGLRPVKKVKKKRPIRKVKPITIKEYMQKEIEPELSNYREKRTLWEKIPFVKAYNRSCAREAYFNKDFDEAAEYYEKVGNKKMYVKCLVRSKVEKFKKRKKFFDA